MVAAEDLFETQDEFVVVDINRGPCYGRTVCDENNVLKQQPNAKVGQKINHDGFFDLVEDCIRLYS